LFVAVVFLSLEYCLLRLGLIVLWLVICQTAKVSVHFFPSQSYSPDICFNYDDSLISYDTNQSATRTAEAYASIGAVKVSFELNVWMVYNPLVVIAPPIPKTLIEAVRYRIITTPEPPVRPV